MLSFILLSLSGIFKFRCRTKVIEFNASSGIFKLAKMSQNLLSLFLFHDVL